MNIIVSVITQLFVAFVLGSLLGAGFAFPFASMVLARRGFKRAMLSD